MKSQSQVGSFGSFINYGVKERRLFIGAGTAVGAV
jgi:hypothetical protein